MRSLLFIALLASLPPAMAAEADHAVEVVNGMHREVASLAVAPAGSGRWAALDMRDNPLEYGMAITVDISVVGAAHAGDNCLQDLRTVFMDGGVVFARNVDVCAHPIYQLRPHAYYVSIDSRG